MIDLNMKQHLICPNYSSSDIASSESKAVKYRQKRGTEL